MFKRFSRFYPCIFMAAVSGLFLFPCQAHAYLDPGTGSLILQGIIGGLAAGAVVAKIYWHRLLRFFVLKKTAFLMTGNQVSMRKVMIQQPTLKNSANKDIFCCKN